MRGLRRPAVQPPTLRQDGVGGKEAARNRVRRAAEPTCELGFPDHWNRPDVRGALHAMQGWVCAYCQCEIDPRDGGDVDHFRPKQGGAAVGHTGYWWLAYSFDNYLLCCRRCNEHIKREQFPVRGNARADDRDDDPEAHEHRLLIDPARDGELVERCLRVDVVDDLCPLCPSPTEGRDHPMCERIEETARLMQLDEDVDARRPRVRARVAVIQATKSVSGTDGLREKAGRYHPHSAAWRDALRTFAPDVKLPSAEEELGWLLAQILERINLGYQSRAAEHEREVWAKRMEQALWTLAFLWKNPPTGRPDDVKAWLDAHKLTAVVEARVRRLSSP